MSADFCLVPHASERNANEIAPHRISDRSPKRGLSHARRPDEAEDGRFTLGPQFKNSQVFEDAFFDFIEVIVIAVENFSRFDDIDLFCCENIPGQCYKPVQIRSRYRVLRGRGRHSAQPPQFAFGFFLGLLGHPGRLDFLP